MKQFVLPADAGNERHEYRLENRDFHYLIRVRRYAVGDRIPALSREGCPCMMEILRIESQECLVSISPVGVQSDDTKVREAGPNPDMKAANGFLPKITLMPAVTKGKKMDLTVRQAVEAGADAIWPLLTENCQVKFPEEKDTLSRRKRWERIFIEALQQCGATIPASVETPKPLLDALKLWNKRGLLIFFHEKAVKQEGRTFSLHSHLAEVIDELAIITGPEGGLSPGEVKLLMEHGAIPAHLGNRVLRAETAAIYGLAAVGTIIREKKEWLPA